MQNTKHTYTKHIKDANAQEKEVFDLMEAFAIAIEKYIYRKNGNLEVTREIFNVIRMAIVNHAGSALSALKECIPEDLHESFINEHVEIIKMKFEMSQTGETVQ